MHTSMVFLNRFLKASPAQIGWTQEPTRRVAPAISAKRPAAASGVLLNSAAPAPATAPAFTPATAPGVERVCEMLSQHMAQGVCIAEIAAGGAAPALRVVHENAAFRRVGGLSALAGDGGLAQFAAKLAERVAAAAGKSCTMTASSGIVFQVTASGEGAPSRVVILCEPARRNAKERELLSTVAHEMRNNMSALCGAVEVLAAHAGEGAKPARALAIARRQLEDMRRFVDDLLSVGRDTKREFEITRAPLRVRDLVLETVETHGGEAERRGIELVVPSTSPYVMVVGDAGRLRQVLSNLLLNACKFTPSGGRITLSVTSDAQQVRISVADTGSGIDADQMAAIFEPFGQEHYTDDQSSKGLGIGLCVARRLVQLHGGTLGVASEGRDRGSEFVVTLPLGA
jgi:signal transduction histidine kinase